MGLVLKTFRCKITGLIHYKGDTYEGARLEELVALGVVAGTDGIVDYSRLKTDELRAELKNRGIEFNAKAKKDELLELLKSSSD